MLYSPIPPPPEKPRKIGPLPSLPLQWLSPAAPPPKLFGDCVSEVSPATTISGIRPDGDATD
ncbi:unnamed protein product [Brassica napus]|uniref:Uncharacterized protein n=2 Tax=Brassica TaxID=3705 RepID=A0ABQ7BC71_BRACR|nr:hypothetical protein DY000_02041938 [Brassica cretica]CAF2076887.1 unnamed protein product [Brassica napus]